MRQRGRQIHLGRRFHSKKKTSTSKILAGELLAGVVGRDRAPHPHAGAAAHEAAGRGVPTLAPKRVVPTWGTLQVKGIPTLCPERARGWGNPGDGRERGGRASPVRDHPPMRLEDLSCPSPSPEGPFAPEAPSVPAPAGPAEVPPLDGVRSGDEPRAPAVGISPREVPLRAHPVAFSFPVELRREEPDGPDESSVPAQTASPE